MRRTKVLLTGGGTGGHIFPLVAVARSLHQRSCEVAFVGPEEFSLDSLRAEGVLVQTIVPAGKLRRYLSFENVRDAIRFPFAFLQSRSFIKSWRPDIVLGKGGYGSLGPVLAARQLKIPVVLHESDVQPGLANRMLARFADHILLSFTEARQYFPGHETSVVGNPVRALFTNITKREARTILGVTTRKKVIFITGGSQGAHTLNRFFGGIAPALAKRYGLIVASGSTGGADFFSSVKDSKHVLVRSFFDEQNLAAAYTLADVVVARAGAGSIFEIALFGKPSILIPLATAAGNHQETNARAYEKTGAAIVLREKEINEQIAMYAIDSVLKNTDTQTFMSAQAKSFSTPQAADEIASILLAKAHDRFWSKITKQI